MTALRRRRPWQRDHQGRAHGGPGDDRLDAGAGQNDRDDQLIAGGDGNDVLLDDGGNGRFDGGAGNDTIYGFGGEDDINAGDGDDVVFTGAGQDKVDCGPGNDIAYASSRGEADGFRNCEVIVLPTPAARVRQVVEPPVPYVSGAPIPDGFTVARVFGTVFVMANVYVPALPAAPNSEVLAVGPSAGIVVAAPAGSVLPASSVAPTGSIPPAGTFSGPTRPTLPTVGTVKLDGLPGLPGTAGTGPVTAVKVGGVLQVAGVDPIDNHKMSDNRTLIRAGWSNAALVAAGKAGADILDKVQAQESRIICSFAKGCRGNTAKDERIIGTAGADKMSGGGGSDWLEGAGGSDRLSGGAGDDQLFGRFGNDVMDGGPGDDQLEGGRGDDTLKGGAGNDDLNGGFGKDKLFGGAGDDRINAVGGGADVIDCGPGHDAVAKDKKDRTRNCEVVL